MPTPEWAGSLLVFDSVNENVSKRFALLRSFIKAAKTPIRSLTTWVIISDETNCQIRIKTAYLGQNWKQAAVNQQPINHRSVCWAVWLIGKQISPCMFLAPGLIRGLCCWGRLSEPLPRPDQWLTRAYCWPDGPLRQKNPEQRVVCSTFTDVNKTTISRAQMRPTK